MTLLYVSIPIMILAVGIAILPLVQATRRQRRARSSGELAPLVRSPEPAQTRRKRRSAA